MNHRLAICSLLTLFAVPAMAGKWVYTVQSSQVTLMPDPFFAGGQSEARDINIHWQIVGWADAGIGVPNAFLQEPGGVYKNVGIPLQTSYAAAYGINNVGEVVGVWLDKDVTRGFYWHPSRGFNKLGTQLQPGESYNDEYDFIPQAINDFGRIVGSAKAEFNSPHIPFKPCTWDVPIYWVTPESEPRVLYCPKIPDGDNYATDLNIYGWTVGYETDTDQHGFRFHEGKVSFVPPLSPSSPHVIITAVNEKAAVAGEGKIPALNSYSHALYWDGKSEGSVFLGVLPGDMGSRAEDLNDEDFAAGYSQGTVSTESGMVPRFRPFLWRADFGMYELPTPPAGAGPAWTRCAVNALANYKISTSSTGIVRAVGYCWRNGKKRAARWDVQLTRYWLP